MSAKKIGERDRLRLLRHVMVAGQKAAPDQARMARGDLTDLLELAFEELAFEELVDERWYLKRYPDVAVAIRKGQVKSASQHYFQAGIYEGRVPYEIGIDSTAYLQKHRDVAEAVSQGTYRNGRDHFLTSGFAEGRDFALKAGVSRRSRA